MLFCGHVDPRGPINDQEELVAWLASAGQNGVGRNVENPSDLGDELSLAAAFKERDSLEPFNPVVLVRPPSGGDGFEATLSIVWNRPVHHPMISSTAVLPFRSRHLRSPNTHCS